MNDTTVIPTRPEAEDVRAYIAAVRRELADLPAEDVEDLTGGMEADLAERVAESGGLLGDLLGRPEAYAAELRAAAGLPPRPAATGSVKGQPGRLAEALRETGASLLLRFPWLRDLRQVWWVSRGVTAGWTVGLIFGTIGATMWVFGLLGAAGSLWLGRRTAEGRLPDRVAVLVTLGNLLAVVLLLPVASAVLSARVGYVDTGEPASYGPQDAGVTGVVVDGEAARQLYAYDAAGNRLDGVRIFDGNGRVVQLDPMVLDDLVSESIDEGSPVDPEAEDGQVRGDVFPVRWGTQDGWVPLRGLPTEGEQAWVPPLTIVPLPERTGSAPGESATPSPSATPTATPTSGPATPQR